MIQMSHDDMNLMKIDFDVARIGTRRDRAETG